MALNDAMPQPNVPAVTAAPPDPGAAPDINSSAPAMDLSALSALAGPGVAAQPTVEGTQEYKGMVAANTAQAAAIKKASDIANQPAPPPPPHQRLMNMIAGLGAGLSGFGTAIATHGKEGGAAEVQDIMGARQQQQIQERQAALAQKNAAVQQQITIGETNRQLAQSYLNLMTVPDEITGAHVKLQEEQAGLAESQQRLQAGGVENQSARNDFISKWGYAPDITSPDAIGKTTNGAAIPNAAAMQSRYVGYAANVLPGGDKNPDVIAAKAALGSAKNNDDVIGATAGLRQAVALNTLTVETKGKEADLITKQQSSDPLFKFQSDPKALADPGAQATLQAFIDNPANKGNLNGIAQAQSLIAKAGIAQQHAIDLDKQKTTATKNAEQAATAGDPEDTGRMLLSGGLTLADLKSRGSTPKQIVAASEAAERQAKASGQTYNPSDEIVGEHALSGLGNQTFFGSARSLVQSGGMFDQLKAAHDALGNGKIPVYNKYQDWLKYQAGSPELATYRAAVLAAADDYSKVMTGGTGSDSSRQSSADQFIYQMNQGQFNGSVEQARAGVRSQVTGRIGSNRYVQQREGDILKNQTAAPTGATSEVWIGGKLTGHVVNKKFVPLGQ